MSFDKDDILELRRRALRKDFSRMNDRQQQAVFHADGPVLILAGAGSGKTTVLVNRIANLVRYGKAYESTFIQPEFTEADADNCKNYLEGGGTFGDYQGAAIGVGLPALADNGHNLYE